MLSKTEILEQMQNMLYFLGVCSVVTLLAI